MTQPPDAFGTREVAIGDESIKLGQFLKLADLVDSGADGKALIADGFVRVNGDPEIRRGRQLVPGDEVSLAEHTVRVTN